MHPVSGKQGDSLQVECGTDSLLLPAFFTPVGQFLTKHQSEAGGDFVSVGVNL